MRPVDWLIVALYAASLVLMGITAAWLAAEWARLTMAASYMALSSAVVLMVVDVLGGE